MIATKYPDGYRDTSSERVGELAGSVLFSVGQMDSERIISRIKANSISRCVQEYLHHTGKKNGMDPIPGHTDCYFTLAIPYFQ